MTALTPEQIMSRNRGVGAALLQQAAPYLWGVNDCIETAALYSEAAGLGAKRVRNHPAVKELRGRTQERALVWARGQEGGFAGLYAKVLIDCGATKVDRDPLPGEMLLMVGDAEIEGILTPALDDGHTPMFVSPTYEWLAWTPMGLRAYSGDVPDADDLDVWTWDQSARSGGSS